MLGKIVLDCSDTKTILIDAFLSFWLQTNVLVADRKGDSSDISKAYIFEIQNEHLVILGIFDQTEQSYLNFGNYNFVKN